MYRRSTLACLLTLILGTAPVLAYTVVLRDGSRVEARDKYVIEGDKAIITLMSGTETFIDASEIDVEATEEANKHQLGNALVLEDGEFVQKKVVSGETKQRERLGDLIERGEASMRGTARPDGDVSAPRISTSTTDDTAALRREPLRDIDLAAAIKQRFSELGFDGVGVFQGTANTRPFVEVRTDSEASVFRSLEVAAEVLTSVREEFADQCDVLELVLTTSNQQRAGDFEIGPELAAALQADGADVPNLFVEHVRF